MKFVLIGAGQRGMIYAKYAYKNGHEITAVAETDPVKREIAASEFGIPAERCYETGAVLFAGPCMGEAAIIATMDRDHYSEAIPAMEKGVLRYSPFFREIRRVIAEGRIGRVITIQHNENIGNFHIAHSFVRGNWRRSDLSSPLIMQKSCHDMDLLVWLTGSKCSSVASFGDLTYFRKENAPEGAAERCCDCPLKDGCRFSAYRSYLPLAGNWPATVLTDDQSEEGLLEAIRTGPYGRCVYHCDNNVCDHQVTILKFENGVTATFNLSGFTNLMTRTMKIMGEDGEIRASEAENVIEVTRFAGNNTEKSESEIIRPEQSTSGHSGGDSGIVEDFLSMLEGRDSVSATEIHESVESHMMACAAEEARLTGTVVSLADFRRKIEGTTKA